MSMGTGGNATCIVRARPVVFACRGCERNSLAADVAVALDRRGLAEASLAGFDADKARSRYPVYAVEGCERACATQWLSGLGAAPQRCILVDASRHAAAEIERVVRGW